MSQRDAPCKLLVEGRDDKRVIPELIEAHGIEWGSRDEPIVTIEAMGGIDAMLEKSTFRSQLKSSGLRALGLLVDADQDPSATWRRIRDRCRETGFEPPDDLPGDGVVLVRVDRLRLGAWILPDNQSPGMLETLLGRLVAKPDDPVWRHAVESQARARLLGAPCKPVHDAKARVHTWLAWQDPPGPQLHDAVRKRLIEPRASAFVDWFRRLYEV